MAPYVNPKIIKKKLNKLLIPTYACQMTNFHTKIAISPKQHV